MFFVYFFSWAGLSFSALFMASIIYIAYLVDHIDLGQKVVSIYI